MNVQIQFCMLRFYFQWYVLQADIASTPLSGGRNIMFFDFDVAFLPIIYKTPYFQQIIHDFELC